MNEMKQRNEKAVWPFNKIFNKSDDLFEKFDKAVDPYINPTMSVIIMLIAIIGLCLCYF